MSPGNYIKQAWRESGKLVSLKRFAGDCLLAGEDDLCEIAFNWFGNKKRRK